MARPRKNPDTAPDDAEEAESGADAADDGAAEDQRVNPDPDFDFRDEEHPDNTTPPMGRP